MWCDTHVSPPLSSIPGTLEKISDERNFEIGFFPDVPAILKHLRYNVDGVEALVSASRTETPHIAQEMLELLHIPGHDDTSIPAWQFLDHKVWGVGSKIHHFRKIQEFTGADFKDMLFFDDEHRNIDVQHKLGVTFVLVDEDGLTWETYERGLNLWRKRNGLK